MEEAEKLALSTSLPELINQVVVNTRLKVSIISSGILDEDVADSIIEKNNGQNLIFKLVQRMKRGAEAGSFSKLEEVLRATGQGGAADVLHTHLAKHSQLPGESPDRRSVPPNEGYTERTGGQQSSAGDEAVSGPARVLSSQDIADFRKQLRSRLPARGTDKAHGDVAVLRSYDQAVYEFAESSSHCLPGPLPDIDITMPTYEQKDLRYLPTEVCALLSRVLGGKPHLSFYREHGHQVLRTRQLHVVYCRVKAVYVEPGALLAKSGFWVSTESSLGMLLSNCTVWSNFEAWSKFPERSLDLSLTAREWYSHNRRQMIALSRKNVHGDSAEELSIPEKQKLLLHLLEAGKEMSSKVAVDSDYAEEVAKFARGRSDKEPGQLQGPSATKASHHSNNITQMPVECAATLIEFYGGNATLVFGTERGSLTLDTMVNQTTYIGAGLQVQDEKNASTNSIGSFFLSADHTLGDAIGSAVGWFPSRVRTDGVERDLDLHVSVREWFDVAKKNVIILLD